MEVLRPGSTGAEVAFLQSSLSHALSVKLARDGVFGNATQSAVLAFQSRMGLRRDGIAGAETQRALRPWMIGSLHYTLRRGDTLWQLSRRFGVTIAEIETANPGLDPFRLMPGQTITVPLPFPVVPEDVPMSAALAEACVSGLALRYPFLRASSIGKSGAGRELWLLRVGSGRRRVLTAAAFHANEWITASLLLRFAEELCRAYAKNAALLGIEIQPLLARCELALVPLVDPDGTELVTGAEKNERILARTREIAAAFPSIAYPSGWKADILGTDLNLQFPAGWESARQIKFAQGYTRPAPRDFVGTAPLSAAESRALFSFTRAFDPALVLAYHTQGEVIYANYGENMPAGTREYAALFASRSGYTVERVPYASSFAGYKDWFIDAFDRPGFTIEAGRGENPLPLAQLPEIYEKNLGILLAAAQGL